jgi:parallel beta-helix repeat protein
MTKYPLPKKCLAVGIILLFIGTAIIPSNGQKIEKSSLPASRGHWLYVGGSGPGNYTRIQDAIDNASDGDTIFVFSGIYNETIVVNMSISLLGEKKETTIITNDGTTDIITLNTDYCSLRGFTILNEKSDTHANGLTVNSDGNLISDNIIGTVYSKAICLYNAHDNRIENNFIKNTYNIGIYIGYSNRNTIQKNRITKGIDGIHIYFTSSDNMIISNQIDNTSDGISFWCETQRNNVSLNQFEYNGVAVDFFDGATDNIVFQNYFEKNDVGVAVRWRSELNKIFCNTFMKNKISSFYFLYLKNTNVWDNNYWSIPRITPKLVFGLTFVSPYLTFDKHPAREPYDIPGMS